MLIEKNVSLKNLTTFRIGGPARFFCEVYNEKEVGKAICWAQKNSLPFYIVAGGSNLLVADKGFNGLVIKLQITSYKQETNAVRAEAGVRLADLVKLCLKQGLSGLEWAAGIPQATVGGAVWGNAGAFGKTIGEVVREVGAMQSQISNLKSPQRSPSLSLGTLRGRQNENAKFKIFGNKDCQFRYKDSIFKRDRGLVILSAKLVLEKKTREEVKNKVQEILDYRKEHHPVEPSAGSVFKNYQLSIINASTSQFGPELTAEGLSTLSLSKGYQLLKRFPGVQQFEKMKIIPAGWLIEQCGLKGKIIGGAQISPKHANFIVNTGGAKAGDVIKLIKLAKKRVKEKFGIELEEEIQYLGF